MDDRMEKTIKAKSEKATAYTIEHLVPFIVADIKVNYGTLEAAQARGLYKFRGGYSDEYVAAIRKALEAKK